MRILPALSPAGRTINGETMKTLLHRNHDEATINSFRKDPEFAAEYLNAILEDGDQQELLGAPLPCRSVRWGARSRGASGTQRHDALSHALTPWKPRAEKVPSATSSAGSTARSPATQADISAVRTICAPAREMQCTGGVHRSSSMTHFSFYYTSGKSAIVLST